MPGRLTIIRGVFEWTVERDPDSGQHVAECSVLNLLAWGDSNDELLGCIQRVTGMLVEHLVETERLESFMRNRGFFVVTIPIPDSIPETFPAPDWPPQKVPVLWPTTRIMDASLTHA